MTSAVDEPCEPQPGALLGWVVMVDRARFGEPPNWCLVSPVHAVQPAAIADPKFLVVELRVPGAAL